MLYVLPQNNLTELWALLNLLYPDVFPSSAVFDAGFNISDGIANADTMQAHSRLPLLPKLLLQLRCCCCGGGGGGGG